MVHAHYFLAIPLPTNVKEHLKDIMEDWSCDLPFQKWVHPSDLHITLVFLGSVNDRSLSVLTDDLQMLKKFVEPFSLRLSHVDFFGSKERPRILWASVEADDALYALEKQVKVTCEQHSFRVEERPYRPHITLARRWLSKTPFNLNVVDHRKQIEPLDWQVENFVLYRTNVGKVPRYQVIQHFPL